MKAFLRLFVLAAFGVAGGFGAVWLYQQETEREEARQIAAARPDPVVEALAERAAPTRSEPRWETSDWPEFALDRDIPDAEGAPSNGNGITILLADQQSDLTLDTPAHLYRYVVLAENSAGSTHAGTFNVPFDPAHQHLVIHRADVIRDGERLDGRDRLAVDFVQQENLLNQGILTGMTTALIRIADVRGGDTVDFAASVVGGNPLLGERRADAVSLVNTVMAVESPIRVTIPRDAEWVVLGNGIEVEESRRGGRVILDFPSETVRPATYDIHLPQWLQGRPMLQVSSFEGWEAVREWGDPMYAVEPDAEIEALAERFLSEHDTLDAQVGAAINFVQDEIRYFAVALGTGGYIPASTSETLRTRSGDCKAKTVLLMAILDAMGVEAEAVFVNSAYGLALNDFAASPIAFNHVITRVRVDNRWRWIDPTIPHQASLFSNITQPIYGFGLVLDGRSTELTAIDSDIAERMSLTIRERFTISLEEGAPVRVRTDMIATGASARQLRAGLASGLDGQFDQGILQFYRGTYGEAEISGERRMLDDREANRISLTWDIDLLPIVSEQSRGNSLYLEAYSIPDILPDIDLNGRTSPISVTYPFRARHEIVVELPEDWDVEGSFDRDLENSIFRFVSRGEEREDTFRFHAELETLRTHTQPMALLTVRSDAERMDSVLRFEARGPGGEPDEAGGGGDSAGSKP